MRAALLGLLLLAGTALAQEHAQPAAGHEAAGHEATGHGGEHGDPLLPYKFLNFAVLAGALGFVVVKVGLPALRGQQATIAESLIASARKAEEAAREAAAIEARMSNLDEALAGIRAKARDELAAESARMARETEAHMLKIQQAAALEIASAAKAASGELKAHAADLALNLAAEKIRRRLDAPAQARLADGFIRNLEAQR